jgi:putative CocE/NonD family hydrolase
VDKFRYDPMNAPPFITEPSFSQVGGPDDYRSVERRDDILVYTSDPFPEPVEVCGPLSVHLVAASSVKDTDWATKIIDVHPDGFAQRLNDGLVRARYYKDATKAQFLTPGKAEQYDIDNWATCQLFGKGHRLRLEVLSSAFPKWDRNLNTGGPLFDDAKVVVAEQTIHHSRDALSYVLLPIVPRR